MGIIIGTSGITIWICPGPICIGQGCTAGNASGGWKQRDRRRMASPTCSKFARYGMTTRLTRSASPSCSPPSKPTRIKARRMISKSSAKSRAIISYTEMIYMAIDSLGKIFEDPEIKNKIIQFMDNRQSNERK